jgi:predicted alpha/beta hydrolase
VNGVVANLFFRAVLPAAVATFGHTPGWLMGGEPLPPAVARQWVRWGLTRGWAMADPAMRPHASFGAVVAPVHLWSVTDDLTYAPPRAVDALAEVFRHAATQRQVLSPASAGVRRLGHFGAFRREVGPRVWPQLLAPIEAAVPRLRAAVR